MSWVKIDCHTAARRFAAGREGADDVAIDEAEGAAHLVTAGEQVRGVDASRQAQPGHREEVLEVAAELPVAGHPPAPARVVQIDLLQGLGVALEQGVRDDLPVEDQLVAGRGRALAQPLAGAARRPLGDDAHQGEGPVLRLRLRAQVPHGAVRGVVRPQERALPFHELGHERIARGELRDRLDGAPFVRRETEASGLRKSDIESDVDVHPNVRP